MVLQEREMNLLLALLRYRYLETTQIKKLFFPTQTRENMYRVLKKLSNGELIAKKSFPKTHNLSMGYLVFLTDKGGKTIARHFKMNLDEIGYKRIKKPIKTVNRFYHRKRMIDFWIKLDKELMPSHQDGDIVELSYLITDNEKEKRNDKLVAKTHIKVSQDRSIIPDIIFKLRNEKKDLESVFFVEIDTGTETIGGRFLAQKPSSILDKFERYKALCDIGSKAWADVAKTHEQFRVLFVTETFKHIENIQKKIKKAIPSDYLPLYLFSTHEVIEERGVLSDKSWIDIENNLTSIV